MTNPEAAAVDAGADIRWREWKARGAASDRQTVKRMRIVRILIVSALAVWSLVQLT